MARTAIAVNVLSRDTVDGTTNQLATPTTIDSTLVTNKATFKNFGKYRDSWVLIRVYNSHSSDHTVTFEAGDDADAGGPSTEAFYGDRVETVPLGKVCIFVLESARHTKKQDLSSGTPTDLNLACFIKFSSGFTGTIEATVLPSGRVYP